MNDRDARRRVRKALGMPAQVKTRHRLIEVEVSDLTESGCKIAARHMWVDVGSEAVLLPEGFEGFKGTIRWADEGLAGMEFKQPLHTAVVDHLCRRYPGRKAMLDLGLDYDFGNLGGR